MFRQAPISTCLKVGELQELSQEMAHLQQRDIDLSLPSAVMRAPGQAP